MRRKRGREKGRILALTSLRAMVLLLLIFLAARPIQVAKEPPAAAARAVVVLMDRSESMSLEEHDASRYQQALGFLRERLLRGNGQVVLAALPSLCVTALSRSASRKT